MPDSEPLPRGGPDSWWADRGSASQWGPRPRGANRLSQGHGGSQVLALGVLPSRTWLPPATQGTAGTYQVPGGSHQLVGGEGEGLVAQVCVEHLLEDGPAGARQSWSVTRQGPRGWAGCHHWGGGEQDKPLTSWAAPHRHGVDESPPRRKRTKQPGEKATSAVTGKGRWTPAETRPTDPLSRGSFLGGRTEARPAT